MPERTKEYLGFKLTVELEQVLKSTVGSHGFWLWNHLDIIGDFLNQQIEIKGFRKVMTELDTINGYSDLVLDVYDMINKPNGSYIYHLIRERKAGK